jgi:hypothetical protein
VVDLGTFRAWHPSGGSLPADELVCPVYDTLSAADFRRFGDEPNNAANFVARPSSLSLEDFLEAAPKRLRAALSAGAFTQDEEPALYVYGIRYVPPADIAESLAPEDRRPEYLLLGLVGTLDLARQPAASIALHERTFADRIDERVRLTEATRMHFAPILAGYSQPDHGLNNLLEAALGIDRRELSFEGARPPIVEARLDGTVHRLWRIDERDLTCRITDRVRDLRLLILDGHHRFTAARERHESGARSAPPCMLVENRDRALLLLPWHRVIPRSDVAVDDVLAKAKAEFPSVERLPAEPSIPELAGLLRAMTARRERGFVIHGGGTTARVIGPPSSDGGWDFDLLHDFLDRSFGWDPHAFRFERSPRAAWDAVHDPGSESAGGIAFLLPGLDARAVEERAFSTGRPMAHKSTMFLPKVAEGVLFAPAA